MARTDQKCLICKADQKVRAAVEARRAAGIKLDDLAKESGFSRAGLGRHFQKHVLRFVLTRHRDIKLNMRGARLVTRWPDGLVTVIEADRFDRTWFRYIGAEEIKPDDVLQIVRFDEPLPPPAEKINLGVTEIANSDSKENPNALVEKPLPRQGSP